MHLFIHFERVRESLPMNSNTVISLIMDIYIHNIPFRYTNHRPWKLFIYNQHALAATQPCKVGLLQLYNLNERNDQLKF